MKLEPKFKVGDLVVLKSGGPKMTVDEIEESLGSFYGKVNCKWFYGTDVKEEIFHQDALEEYKEDNKNDLGGMFR